MKTVMAGCSVALTALLAVAAPAQAAKWFMYEGEPLHYPDHHYPYWLDEKGLEGMAFETVEAVVADAFGVWNAQDSVLTFEYMGPTDAPEKAFYTDGTPNENHVLFVRTQWDVTAGSGHSSEIAFTSITYSKKDRTILDADILVNDDDYDFADCATATGPQLQAKDLFYVILHEAGHMLGFDHETADGFSVMYVRDANCEDEPPHFLSPDDVEGFDSFYGTEEFATLPVEPMPDAAPDVFVEDLLSGDAGAVDANGGDPGCHCRMGRGHGGIPGGVLVLTCLLAMGYAVSRRRRRLRWRQTLTFRIE